jgi:hypothetical protein
MERQKSLERKTACRRLSILSRILWGGSGATAPGAMFSDGM